MYLPRRLRFIFFRLFKKAVPMPANEILQEAKKLHKLGDSLNVLAEQNAPVAEALAILSGNLHDTANLLKVVVAMKMGVPAELDTVIH